MKVLLLADVVNVGRAGEVKEVKNGYARNYLLPQKLAAPATADQMQRIKAIIKAAEEQRLKEEKDMQALAEALSQAAVTVRAKIGPTGKFYGAVTPIQIGEALSKLTGRPIDRRSIVLEQPIHEPGEHEVQVRLAQGVVARVKVVTEAEQE